jgi:hypothetical protein
MRHALTLAEAVKICFGNPVAIVAYAKVPTAQVIAPEYDMTCSYIEDRITFLARYAGRRCPV